MVAFTALNLLETITSNVRERERERERERKKTYNILFLVQKKGKGEESGWTMGCGVRKRWDEVEER